MKVKELKKLLADRNDEAEVLITLNDLNRDVELIRVSTFKDQEVYLETPPILIRERIPENELI